MGAWENQPVPPEVLKRLEQQQRTRKTLWEKCKEDPYTPIGAVVTTGILCWGVSTLYTGNRILSQKLMRARVAAQGITLVICTYSIYNSAQRRQQQQQEQQENLLSSSTQGWTKDSE